MDNSSKKIRKETPTRQLAGRVGVGLKVCGMNKNPEKVAALQPDYLGFIFWEPSKRFFNQKMPELNINIKKVGVFVDATFDELIQTSKKYSLAAVQLHGQETAEYCKSIKSLLPQIEIIKVFSIKDEFDFSILASYEDVCDYYLFDTKGKLPGGNGYTFNWEVLKNYPSTKPYFLSGGIGLEEIDSINEFMKRPEAKFCHAIDVNSKFEMEPGLKNIEKVKEFKDKLTSPLERWD